MDLAGKTALITGASGKVGRVLVPVLAAQGVRCLCQYNRRGGFADDLTPPATAIRADLAAPGGIEELFREVDLLARPEILIQLAGTFERARLEDLTDEAMRAQIEINLIAPMRVARQFARRLLAGPGKIIHFTDIAASRPWAEYSVYCAAKAAMTAFTQSLAKELAPRILVNAVAPGTLEGGLSPEQEAKEIRRIPAARLGTYEEVADAVVFLLKNDYFNGHVLTIDGGRSI